MVLISDFFSFILPLRMMHINNVGLLDEFRTFLVE